MLLNIDNIKTEIEKEIYSKKEIIYVLDNEIKEYIEKEFLRLFKDGNISTYDNHFYDFFKINHIRVSLDYNNYEKYHLEKVFDDITITQTFIKDGFICVEIKVNGQYLHKTRKLELFKKIIEQDFLEDMIIAEFITEFRKDIGYKEDKLLNIKNFYIDISLLLSKKLNSETFNNNLMYIFKKYNRTKNKKELLKNFKYFLINKSSEYLINDRYIYLNYYKK